MPPEQSASVATTAAGCKLRVVGRNAALLKQDRSQSECKRYVDACVDALGPIPEFDCGSSIEIVIYED